MKQNKLIIGMIIVVVIIIIIITIVLAYLLKNIKENQEIDNTDISSIDTNINTNTNTGIDENTVIEDQNVVNDNGNNEDVPGISEEEKKHIASLYETYKQNLINAPAEIYNRLDPDFKAKRFPTTDKFKEYLTKVHDYIEEWEISEYKKVDKGDYIQYIILNEDEVYLFINESPNQEYTYILDNHTLDTEESIQQYDNATNQEKAQINSEKIVEAMATYDYEYVYNKLDTGFKQKRFNTLELYKKYFDENIFMVTDNTIDASSQEGDKYIEEVCIDGGYVSLKIEMKLLDNRDFVFVFSIEDHSGTVE